MCRLFFAVFFLAFSLPLFCQAVSPTTPSLTSKEKALQLVENLKENNVQAQNLSIQSQEQLQTALNENKKLKDSLQKMQSYSTSLEGSLAFSLTVNKIVIPITVTVSAIAIVEAFFLFMK